MATSSILAKVRVRFLKMGLVDPAPFGHVHLAAEVDGRPLFLPRRIG
jgi:hypothetical protein